MKYPTRISPGSMQYQTRISAIPVQDQTWISPGSVQYQSWISPVSMQYQNRISPGPMQYKSTISPGSVQDQCSISGWVQDQSWINPHIWVKITRPDQLASKGRCTPNRHHSSTKWRTRLGTLRRLQYEVRKLRLMLTGRHELRRGHHIVTGRITMMCCNTLLPPQSATQF
jgi:hypothetical protein